MISIIGWKTKENNSKQDLFSRVVSLQRRHIMRL
jgi:hypothetical protein